MADLERVFADDAPSYRKADPVRLAAVDIDRDDCVRVTRALLRDPVCGRIGAKGVAFLVRLRGDGKYCALKVDGGPKIGEILCDNRFLVLPPTTHPDTRRPYRWDGRPLLEVDHRELPIPPSNWACFGARWISTRTSSASAASRSATAASPK